MYYFYLIKKRTEEIKNYHGILLLLYYKIKDEKKTHTQSKKTHFVFVRSLMLQK